MTAWHVPDGEVAQVPPAEGDSTQLIPGLTIHLPEGGNSFMPIAAGIAFIVLGAIFKFAVTGGKIGGLDLHVVGIILMLAGVIGMLLPILIRNRSRLTRPVIRNRQDVIDERSRTVVRHTDGSQTLVEHDDGAQTFVEHFDAEVASSDGQRAPGSRQPWAGSGHS